MFLCLCESMRLVHKQWYYTAMRCNWAQKYFFPFTYMGKETSVDIGKMAARTDAAAHSSSRQQCVLLFLFVCLFFLCPSCRAFITYSRQDLFRIGLQSEQFVIEDFTNTHNIPPDIAQPPGSPWTVIPTGRRRRRRKERKQKRGCRAGVLAQLRRRPHKLPLPSIFLSNARSLANKMDELKLQLQQTDSCGTVAFC